MRTLLISIIIGLSLAFSVVAGEKANGYDSSDSGGTISWTRDSRKYLVIFNVNCSSSIWPYDDDSALNYVGVQCGINYRLYETLNDAIEDLNEMNVLNVMAVYMVEEIDPFKIVETTEKRTIETTERKLKIR